MKRKTTRKTRIVEIDRSMRCHTCGRAIAGFESVHYGSIGSGYRDLCNRCFNQQSYSRLFRCGLGYRLGYDQR